MLVVCVSYRPSCAYPIMATSSRLPVSGFGAACHRAGLRYPRFRYHTTGRWPGISESRAVAVATLRNLGFQPNPWYDGHSPDSVWLCQRPGFGNQYCRKLNMSRNDASVWLCGVPQLVPIPGRTARIRVQSTGFGATTHPDAWRFV